MKNPSQLFVLLAPLCAALALYPAHAQADAPGDGDGDGDGDAEPPMVIIESPEDGTSFAEDAVITIEASLDADNSVVEVVLIVDGEEAESKETALCPLDPFMRCGLFDVTLPVGTHVIEVQAIDSQDLVGTSPAIDVVVFGEGSDSGEGSGDESSDGSSGGCSVADSRPTLALGLIFGLCCLGGALGRHRRRLA